MSNGTSLLPEEMREKEKQAREQTRESMSSPEFSMHLPDKEKQKSAKGKEPVKKKKDWVKIGAENNSKTKNKKKAKFKIHHKKVKPAQTVKEDQKVKNDDYSSKNKTEKQSNSQKKQKSNNDFKMRIPKKGKKLDKHGKRVVREAGDKLSQIKHSLPLSEYFQKRRKKLKLKKTPAEINLISSDYREVLNAQLWLRMKILLLVIFIFTLIVAAGSLIFKFHNVELVKEYNSTVQEISQTQAKINSYDTGRMQAEKLKKRSDVLHVLVDNHLRWTAFLSKMERYTIENVYYTNMVVNKDFSVNLQARAKTYADLATQLAVLQEADFVDSVEINSAGKVTAISSPENSDDNISGEEPREINFNILLFIKPDSLLIE
ncbi:MAG TPA: hypothetical protein VKP03_00050 [Patescibacteria group bacterium]|nr:hypothetical protein [Patescibacteria group bacterium]